MCNLMDFDTFQSETLFKNVMANGSLDSWSNYSGPTFDGWLCGLTRTRDSDTLAESNFESALNRLGGESDNVEVHRFGHWACGWLERIMVKADTDQARELYSIYKDLENYPVLDDSDYSERECEYQSNFAEEAKEELAEALEKHFKVKSDKTLLEIAYALNMECQSYYGSDSCINIYSFRIPEKHDLEQLQKCLDELQQDFKTGRVFKQLRQAVTEAQQSYL